MDSSAGKKRFNAGLAGRICLLFFFLVAAILPVSQMYHPTNRPVEVAATIFPGWPSTFEHRKLRELPLSPLERQFERGFPGKIAAFSDNRHTVVCRWVTTATRQLHSAADCYRGSGFEIRWLPGMIDDDGNRWSSFEASQRTHTILVRERIFDSHHNSWSDVSDWYWAALFNKTTAPWWSITVTETDAQNYRSE